MARATVQDNSKKNQDLEKITSAYKKHEHMWKKQYVKQPTNSDHHPPPFQTQPPSVALSSSETSSSQEAKEVDRRNGKGIPRFTAGAVEGSQDFFHSSSSHDYTWFLWDEYDYVYHPMIIWLQHCFI